MRNILLLFLLFFAAAAFGQKVIDTTEIYNGELTRKKIEFKSTGDISKEIYYHPNGKIETEYFLDNGKRIRWIAYDENGKLTSEWNDPEIGHAKLRKMRNITFSLSLLVIGGLIIAGSKVSYRKTYYSLLCLSVIYPFIIFLLEQRIVGDEGNQTLSLIIASTLFIFPGLLLVLSMINFYKRDQIPLITTIFAILVSVIFLMFFYVTMKVAGAGMLG